MAEYALFPLMKPCPHFHFPVTFRFHVNDDVNPSTVTADCLKSFCQANRSKTCITVGSGDSCMSMQSACYMEL